MKYLSFTIKKYRAIDSDLKIALDKHRLVPIIGINECGKTTILHAIFSFDHHNDSFNSNIHHLNDVNNLYKPAQKSNALVHAEILITWDEFKNLLKDGDLAKEKGINIYKKKEENFAKTLIISRDLVTKQYNIESDIFQNKILNDKIARVILGKLPYILYFDDFRDSIPAEIEIKKEEKHNPRGWLAIVERLFKKTDKNFQFLN